MHSSTPSMRRTTQRQIILEELGKVRTHPTAQELFDMVRLRLPRIGLGTVYRNLELMAETGRIRKLESGGNQMRFDATTEPHYHVRCLACDKVEDLAMPVAQTLTEDARQASTFAIIGHNVEFTGFCPSCKARAEHGWQEIAGGVCT